MPRSPPSRSPDDALGLSSSAPLASDARASGAAPPHPFATPEAIRYQSAAFIARGGMGRVTAVHDRRLGREVARKDVPPESPDADALEKRLAREAWITARLDHPAIVPIHDAGTDPSGRPFFTMRLIRGRSLEAALDAGDVDTAALLRHFLAVCQALAHAHGRGVVHRDIKPQNIMLGSLGETQVVDWGVARLVGEHADDADPDDADDDDDESGRLPDALAAETIAGRRVGTTAWMSPEQAAGEPAGPQSDVYALGLVLRAILTRAAGTMRRGQARRAVRDQIPPEAAAILARALAARPADRYPDAASLAGDVAAWLDGRRVAAFDYSALDLARRFFRAFRGPIAIAFAALVAIATTVALAFSATEHERDRAVSAEAARARALEAERAAGVEARQALRERERMFAALLHQRATEALQHGARPEAELLAAHALALRPTPEARGVLARFAARAAPSLHAAELAPPCEKARLAPGGRLLACLEPDAVSLWQLAPIALAWRIGRAFDDLAWLTPEHLVASDHPGHAGTLIDAATSVAIPFAPAFVAPRVLASDGAALADTSEALFAWTPDDARARVIVGAPRRQPWALAASGDRAVTYDDTARQLTLIALRTLAHRPLDLPELDSDGPMSAALDGPGNLLAVGTTSGSLRVFRLADSTPAWSRVVATRALTDVRFSPDGRWLAARDERGVVVLHDAASGHPLALPRVPVSAFAWRATPDGAELVTLGTEIQTWSIPRAPEAHTYRATAGIAALALDRSGHLLAVADGRGAVSVFALASGERLAFLPGDDRAVAKDLAFAHGPTPSLAIIWPGRFRTALWSFTAPDPPTALPIAINFARIVARADGHFAGATYGESVIDIAPSGATLTAPPSDGGTVLDLAASADGAWTAQLSSRGLVRVHASDGLEHVLGADDAIAIALDATGTTLALASPHRIDRVDPQTGSALAAIDDDAVHAERIVAVALAADGHRVAAGTIEGSVLVWDSGGALIMHGRAHTQRVSDLAFTPDGTGLVSASWDGTAIRWLLTGLTAARDALVAPFERRYGLGLDHAMRAELR